MSTPTATPIPSERTAPDAAPTRILRWDVPVDDQPHPIGRGNVVMVATRPPRPGMPRHVVEVWTEEHPGPNLDGIRTRDAQVYGTGHEVPGRYRHLGSCLDVVTNGSLVWHVFEVRDPR